MLMKSQEFVIWLKGILDVTDGDMNEKATTVVKSKLNGLFEHEVKEPENKKPFISRREGGLSRQRLKC